MIVHPELRALRGDDSPQRLAQQAQIVAMADWRARPGVAEVLDGVERFAAGAPLEACAALAALFTHGCDAARKFAASYSMATCATLAAAPLGHVPMRHFTDGITSTLLLAQTGNVTLSLVAIDGEGLHGKSESTTASFTPNHTWEHVLAGSADVELVECRVTGPRKAEFSRHRARIAPGSIMHRDGERQARRLLRIDGALVALRLQRRRDAAEATREYDLASGLLLHQAAGNPRDSRIELMLALLGRMQRRDAAPLMADLARGQGSTGLRWQALRECLALDSEAGFAALGAIAASPHDALAAPSGALRAQLIEAYPQLQDVAPCPM